MNSTTNPDMNDVWTMGEWAAKMEAVAAPPAMNTYRIWTLWTDISEHVLDIRAVSADAALTAAGRMGLFSGLGARRRYVGAHAVLVQS